MKGNTVLAHRQARSAIGESPLQPGLDASRITRPSSGRPALGRKSRDGRRRGDVLPIHVDLGPGIDHDLEGARPLGHDGCSGLGNELI